MLSQLRTVLEAHRFEAVTKVFLKLEAAVSSGLFTSWSICIPFNTLESESNGPVNKSPSSLRISAGPADEYRAVNSNHLRFDLGSLSKPLLCGGLLVSELGSELESTLFQRGLPESCLHDTLAGNCSHLADLTLLDLASHQSGLPAWLWFGRGLYNPGHKPLGSLAAADQPDFESLGLSKDRIQSFQRNIMKAILDRSRRDAIGKTSYSDCGYYLLAKIFESKIFARYARWTGWHNAIQNLNSRLGTKLAHASLDPHAHQHAVPYYPYVVTDAGLQIEESIGPSYGPCFDTNANILACLSQMHPELSLHAGLFGSAEDVQRGMAFIVSSLPQGELANWRRDRFCFCLDTPTGEDTLSAAPKYTWSETFGHLSYSGGSAWLRRDRTTSDLLDYWILLTNRTAARQERRLQRSERLFHFDTEDLEGFATSQGPASEAKDLTSCTIDDWLEARERALGETRLVWDPAICRPFPDLRSIRKEAGTLLWTS